MSDGSWSGREEWHIRIKMQTDEKRNNQHKNLLCRLEKKFHGGRSNVAVDIKL